MRESSVCYLEFPIFPLYFSALDSWADFEDDREFISENTLGLVIVTSRHKNVEYLTGESNRNLVARIRKIRNN